MTIQSLRMQALPYTADSSQLFAPISEWPWAVFLDSGRRPLSEQGRYDLIAAEPMTTLVTQGGQTTISECDGNSITSTEDPLLLLQQYIDRYPQPIIDELPFCGGALGYFSYDLGRQFEQLPSISRDEDQLPEMAVGIYDWVIVVDHQSRKVWLVGAGFDPATAHRWDELVVLFTQQGERINAPLPIRVTSAIESNLSAQQYAAAFDQIQHYIHEGDCYQVNLAQRFTATIDGSPWSAYQRLRKLNPAPFAAYMNTPAVQVLSSSPERFLKVSDRTVETSPIKGTVPRVADAEEDLAQQSYLEKSTKDRAENLMIVDLLRNDLSKNCALGSVKVPSLFAIESYATVHHLVSTIHGELAEGKTALDLFRGSFPGGSITGAPKLRAMEIIEFLEPDRRGIYCGSIGYLGFNGNMDTNIAIRTMVHIDGTMRFWAGGGIVADSVMETEYQETFHKAKAMLEMLQPESSKP